MTHIEIFYIDPKTGWAFAEFDQEENQIGSASYYFRKSDAISISKSYHPRQRIEDIYCFW